MRKLLLAAAVGALVAPATAVAGVIDLQDGILNVITNTGGGSPTPTAFSETNMGVTFTFIATDNLVGGGKFNGGLTLPNGIHVGGGGGSSLEFQMTVDTDVTLTGYSTGSAGFELGSPIFDLLDGATVLIDDGGYQSAPGRWRPFGRVDRRHDLHVRHQPDDRWDARLLQYV